MEKKYYDIEKIKESATYHILIRQRNLCPASIKGKKFTLKFKKTNTYFIVLDVSYINNDQVVFGILFEPYIQQEIYWEILYEEFIEKYKKGEINYVENKKVV